MVTDTDLRHLNAESGFGVATVDEGAIAKWRLSTS